MQHSETQSAQILTDSRQRADLMLALLQEIQPIEALREADTSALDWGIRQSVSFFTQTLRTVGFWSDFHGVAGGGLDWISAYVGYTLQCSGEPAPQNLNRIADLLLSDRYHSGAWGWCPGYPADMDSTSWATLFLQKNQSNWDQQSTANILLGHQDALSGGIRTYFGPQFGIAEYLKASEHDDLSGSCSTHLCVTGVALQALLACEIDKTHPAIEKLAQFIRAAQDPDGHWNAYWYHSKHYATTQCVRALLQLGETPQAPTLQHTAQWIKISQLSDGSWNNGLDDESGRVVDTALAVCTALLLNALPEAALEKAVTWLLQKQRLDGSWDSLPILQIPAANDHSPWNIKEWPQTGGSLTQGICVADHNRYFTTATALQALSAWRKRKSSS